MTALEKARKIAAILDNKKAIDVEVIDIGALSTLGDYFVLASGGSSTQVKALVDEIDKQFGDMGIEPRRIEGYQTSMWVLMDYGDVIVHVFFQETREFYGLGRLWGDAPRVDISDIISP